jgi:hypothetical protein
MQSTKSNDPDDSAGSPLQQQSTTNTPLELTSSSAARQVRPPLSKRSTLSAAVIITFALSLILTAVILLTGHARKELSTYQNEDRIITQESEKADVEGAGLIIKDVLSVTKLRLFGSIELNREDLAPTVHRTVSAYGFKIPSDPTRTWTASIYIPANDYTNRRALITDYFLSRGYVARDNEPIYGEFDSTNYDGETDSCEVQRWHQYNEADGMVQSVIIRCALFENENRDAEKLKPFYGQIAADPTVDKASIKMQVFTVKPADTKGYSLYEAARVTREPSKNVETPRAVFYKSPEGDWKLTYMAEGGLFCADVKDADMLKAFAREECYLDDTATQPVSEIILPSN